MRFIHTSDWHLGQRLYGRKRYEEFEHFLNWLATYMENNPIEALLVCGDIFDTTTPGNRALSLYFRFLHRIAGSGCSNVVIIAGNHDSPTMLEAPKDLLCQLNIHVIGTPRQSLDEQVLVLTDAHGEKRAIICAAPFLRDRDIRLAAAGEDLTTKSEKLKDAIRDHYRELCEIAERMQQDEGSSLPIIATGHLFTAGGKTIDGDGVRDLYVGGLAHLAAATFPDCINYLALGHLHVPQKVQGKEKYRYSGSPLPMGFNEAGQQKIVLDVNCTADTLHIENIPVPSFQELLTLQGDLGQLTSQLETLKNTGSTAWIDVRHTGGMSDDPGKLRDTLYNMVAGTSIKILRIQANRAQTLPLTGHSPEESLEELSVEDVFQRCLDSSDYPDEYHRDMLLAFNEIMEKIRTEEQDEN